MELPVIDLESYFDLSSKISSRERGCEMEGLESKLQEMCSRVSTTLRETGALLVKDPRCSVEDNDRFLDMMERYFASSDQFKRNQERPQLHYQVGVTPEGVEIPRSLVDMEMRGKIRTMPKEFQPLLPSGPDPKWRYMWRIGPRPINTKFKELNSEPVIPEGFPEWKETMDSWGLKMISAVEVVAEMAAIGFGLEKDAFTALMKEGPHLLAPTGSDLERHGSKDRVFAGYHYDLNFLTIHGRSRFPGLNIWLRNGEKVEVSVPIGCLLIQAGKQLEWLTGGECLAGMHEVVVTDRTRSSVEAARAAGRSLWRVSSTLFAHVASDAALEPLGRFRGSTSSTGYPPIRAGEFVERELAAINLKGRRGGDSSTPSVPGGQGEGMIQPPQANAFLA
ncbi:2-oxoglutarate (2OG) and Fe(II)-dependent oxygenase superfamily protein [Wolffia australiana]